MSKTNFSTTKCPNCNKNLSIKTWESLNAQLNPEENKKFLNGEFFNFKCTCGHIFNVDYPMLYHNMQKKIMIHYVYLDKVAEAAAYIREMQKYGPFGNKYSSVGNFNYDFRIVTAQNELREKAIIFSNDLDDRIVEIIKLLAFLQLKEDYPDIEVDEILFYVDSETKEMSVEFLGSENFSMIIEKDAYDDVFSTYSETIDNLCKDDIIINGPWALEFMKKYQKK